MCGRYVLALRASDVRQQLEDYNLPADWIPEDDETRQTYNFAPGYRGLVYRADTSDRGGGSHQDDEIDHATLTDHGPVSSSADQQPYKLQSMKWGLIPFWTKRAPDYSSQLKTINCRDDSLIENRGMWTSMKKYKRCIVVAQGFYEWLKKNNGKEKIPYYIKRKDGQLMLMAGLWDCVQYENSEEKLYSYTIITTSSNKQLSFLHDRMPVILDPSTAAMTAWLDSRRAEWSNELQSVLKPFSGDLEIYPVPKEVGKVGNNSPTFIVPIDSKENKNNIANFFSSVKSLKKESSNKEVDVKEGATLMPNGKSYQDEEQDYDETETRADSGSEDNAPLPVSEPKYPDQAATKVKRERSDDDETRSTPHKAPKASPVKHSFTSPTKITRKTRSATSNGSTKKPNPAGTQKITNFFAK